MNEVANPAQVGADEEIRARGPGAWLSRLLGGGLCLFLALLVDLASEPAIYGYKVTLPFLMTTATPPGSRERYGVETFGATPFGGHRHRRLYRAVDPLGLIWKPVSEHLLSHSFNRSHVAVQLVPTPDGSKLFVKRGAIWSDCLNLASEPVKHCGSVRDCCMSNEPEWPGVTDHEGVVRDSRKVETIARAAGVAD